MSPASASVASRTDWTEWIRSGEWKESADTAIPMLPAMAQEIIDLALDPSVTAAQIIALVSKDPLLATRVVQLANSAFSAPSKVITSISEAVVRLGTGLVRNVMTSTCLSALAADPRIYGSRGREYVDHSIGTAYLAWLVAGPAKQPPGEAFLYGLLHDVGKLLIIKLARESARYSVAPPTESELTEVLAERHAEAGGYLLWQWGLPAPLHDPIVWHHEPDRAETHPQAADVAYAANRFAHRYGFACALEDFDPAADPILARIGIDAVDVAHLDLRAPELFSLARKIRP